MNINTPSGMEASKRWMEDHIRTIKDGGIWAIPRSMTVYQFDKKNKIVRRLEGPGDSPTETVLAAMGWTVENASARN